MGSLENPSVTLDDGRDCLRLMVLDYDDTLCPSSWISAAPERVHAATDADAECLRRLEDGIEALLQRAEALNCKVVIITNADEDWVRFSSQQFLPRIVPLLQNLRVVSARRYEHLYPGRSVCWKAAAFTHVAKAFFHGEDPSGTRPREIVSIGDSNDERLAVRAAAAPLDATAKAIKLVDAPSLDTVACQLVAVTAALPFLAAAKTSVDVDVAAVLAYVGAAHRDDGPAQDAVQRVWNDAAWGLLTAIRFQDANPAPVADGTPGSPVSPSITAQA